MNFHNFLISFYYTTYIFCVYMVYMCVCTFNYVFTFHEINIKEKHNEVCIKNLEML